MKKIKVLLFVVLFIELFGCFLLIGCSKQTTITSSNLLRAIDVEELSTAEYIYNGIAEIESGNDTFFVRYNSVVKVGVSLEDIEFSVDNNAKIVDVILPDIIINDVIVDPSSVGYIPSNPNISLNEVLLACESDAQDAARYDEKLYSVAQDNLKATVIALTQPILDEEGYKIGKWYGLRTTQVMEEIK